MNITSRRAARLKPSLWWLLPLLLIFFAGQRHGLWGSDEPREAEIAREMYVSGDWVMPRLDGERFMEKPPLAYWGVALAFHAAGSPSDLTCRIPSALWGLAGALATAWLGTMLAGRRTGILAAFILATSVEWIYITHLLLVDVPLASCVALSLALFWRGYTGKGKSKRLAYMGCMLALGGAFLAKGTVGIILPASAFGAFLLWRRDWKECASLLSPWNIAVLAAATLSWIFLVYRRGGPDALHVFIWHNQFLRFLSPGADHAEPPWYYLPLIFEIVAPWTLFMPPALYRLFSRRGLKTDPGAGRRYLISVILAPLVILTVSSAKRQLYLLPLMPGIAVAIAIWLAGAWEISKNRLERIWRNWGLLLFALLPLGSWGYALWAGRGDASDAAVAALGLAASAALGLCALRSARRAGGRGLAGLAVALLIAAYAAVLSPRLWSLMEKKKGYGELRELLDRRLGPSDSLFLFLPGEREIGSVEFYRDSLVGTLKDSDELGPVLASSPNNYLLVRESIFRQLVAMKAVPESVEIVGCAEIPGHPQLLIRAVPKN